MFFPEYLYQLSPRDQQVTWLDPVVRRVTTTGTAISLSALFTVPNDRAMILQSVVGLATPTAGETTAETRLFVRSVDTAIEVRLKGDASGGPALTNEWIDWQGSILLPPSHVVGAGAVFSAAVASKTVQLELCGILIPVANIQRV